MSELKILRNLTFSPYFLISFKISLDILSEIVQTFAQLLNCCFYLISKLNNKLHLIQFNCFFDGTLIKILSERKGMIKKRVTIKDIATTANLSPPTVSRALNNHPRISERTKKRVLNLAKKMGYTPNLTARGLVKQKSFLLGLLVYDFRNPFYAAITRSIQETAEELGYWVIQASTDDDQEKSQMIVDSMMNLGVEGIIFATCLLEDPLVKNLLDNDFPVVQVNRRLKEERGDQIYLDNVYGAYLAVSHLIRLGYKRIGMISGPENLSTAVGRYQGYVDALKERKIEIDQEIIKKGSFFSQETGYILTKRIMRLIDPPEAIFCIDDYLALGAMWAIAEMELRVPEDVAIVGFDDAELSSHPLIQLTTVYQDAREMGRLTAKIMLDRVAGKLDSEQRIVLEPHLIIRRSCGYHLAQKNKAL